MCPKLFFAIGKLAFGLVAAYAVSRVFVCDAAHQEQVESEEEVVIEVRAEVEEVGGDEEVSREEGDEAQRNVQHVNSDQVVGMQGEVIIVEEVQGDESGELHSDEDNTRGTLAREEVVFSVEVEVDDGEQGSREDVVADDGSGNEESAESDDVDLDISEGEARVRGSVRVVEDIPLQNIVIVDGRFVRVEVEVSFDVRFQLDGQTMQHESDSDAQTVN